MFSNKFSLWSISRNCFNLYTCTSRIANEFPRSKGVVLKEVWMGPEVEKEGENVIELPLAAPNDIICGSRTDPKHTCLFTPACVTKNSLHLMCRLGIFFYTFTGMAGSGWIPLQNSQRIPDNFISYSHNWFWRLIAMCEVLEANLLMIFISLFIKGYTQVTKW